MRPVRQTKTYPEEGNCFSACVASLLELAIDQVPQFDNDPGVPDTWFEKWQAWLRDRNLQLLSFRYHARPEVSAYAIATMPSPRGGFNHAVIVRDDELVFDPHPDPAPLDLATAQYYYLLVPLDPAGVLPVAAGPGDDPLRTVFLDLWTAATGMPGYDKQRWKELRLLLYKRGVRV